ncbi:hypothetical protein VCHENC02_1829A, partial [Vibrio harveyi]
MRNRDI